jgi:hypothetical protein
MLAPFAALADRADGGVAAWRRAFGIAEETFWSVRCILADVARKQLTEQP